MWICRVLLLNTCNALTLRMSGKQIRLQVPTKLCGVNSGLRRWSSGEFQTVGLATENAQVAKLLRRTRGTDSWWHLANRRCWRPGTSVTGAQ